MTDNLSEKDVLAIIINVSIDFSVSDNNNYLLNFQGVFPQKDFK